MQLLLKDPNARRPQSAQSLAETLRRLLEDKSLRPQSTFPKRWWLAAAGVVTAAALLVAVIVWLNSDRGTPALANEENTPKNPSLLLKEKPSVRNAGVGILEV